MGAKPKLFVSNSGGKSSGYMTRKILRMYSDAYDITVCFANTGQEKEETLEFINNCDKQFNFNTVWVEAVIDPRPNKGTTHRIVSYETANRDGRIFEEMIKVYGIPNQSYPHCTRELKLQPMLSYIRSLGWSDYQTAIGIRPDEPVRIDKKADAKGIVYPLIDWFYADKQDVNDWWDEQEFNLKLEEHQGNCSWCWKKSEKKHIRLINENPEIYDFPKKMERLHGFCGNGSDIRDQGARVFFRGHKSANDLFSLAKYVTEQNERQLSFFDTDDSKCGSSCEAFPTRDIISQP